MTITMYLPAMTPSAFAMFLPSPSSLTRSWTTLSRLDEVVLLMQHFPLPSASKLILPLKPVSEALLSQQEHPRLVSQLKPIASSRPSRNNLSLTTILLVEKKYFSHYYPWYTCSSQKGYMVSELISNCRKISPPPNVHNDVPYIVPKLK